jgi:hypothetical protein
MAVPGEPDRAVSVFTLDAKLEHLLGLALSFDPLPVEAPPPEAGAEVMRLVDDLFEAESARLHLEMLEAPSGEGRQIDQVRMMFRLELLLDRMEGYTPHLQLIHRAVFEPLRDRTLHALGFDPSDVVTVVSAYTQRMNAAFGAVPDLIDLMRSLMAKYPLEGPSRPTEEERQAVMAGMDMASSAWPMSYIWNTEQVAEASGVPAAQVEAMLSKMSAQWGCQPDYLLPDNPNQARLHPVVRLDEHSFFVPLSWNLVHGVFPWLVEELRTCGEEALLDAVFRQRDKATEDLTRWALRGIYRDLAIGPLHYDDEEGHGEIDALVASGDCPLIVECKAQSVTPAGRRGAPKRIKSLVDDVVARGTSQLEHARRYLLGGGDLFADRQGGPPRARLPCPVQETAYMLVTFERMDPVAATGGGVEVSPNTWVVCLADLLMVADLLDSPPEFFHYAKARGALRDRGVTVYMESDALGTYIDDRFRGLLARDDGGEALLGYSSGAINDYYTMTPFGIDVPRPRTEVPVEILSSLERVQLTAPDTWSALAIGVMAQHPRSWRKWKKRGRRKSGSVEFRFMDPLLLVRQQIPVNPGEASGLVLSLPK